MKKVAMFQSNYIPWKGYFDIINDVDVFVFYDDVQYTVRDWRNRNIIKSANGCSWLTVPVVNKNLREKKVYEVEIDNTTAWAQKHFKTIVMSYSKTAFLKDYINLLELIYLDNKWTNLSTMNRFIIEQVCKLLNIKTDFVNLQDMGISGNKNGERILKVCRELNCDYVVNGPAAKEFIDQSLFDESGVVLEYKTYEYPTYRQLSFPFEHGVSIFDLLFNTGPEAPYYIWGWRNEK